MTSPRTNGRHSIALPLSCPRLINYQERPATGAGLVNKPPAGG